jgi:enoyl-CoA hydratase
MTDDIRVDEQDGVLTLTFTRDKKLNAVTLEMAAVLREAIEDFADRSDLRVAVITAEGRFFSAGLDIAALAPQPGAGPDGAVSGKAARRMYRHQANHDLYDLIESIEKPVVVAYQGPCMGLGVEMGASCDFRICSDRATFSLPEIANLAVMPGSGGVSRLPRIIGPAWTKWLVMANKTVDAQQALQIGLVHAVHPDAEFAERAREFALELAAVPTEAMGVAKLAIDHSAGSDRRAARDLDRIIQTTLFSGYEHRGKVEAFLGKGKA